MKVSLCRKRTVVTFVRKCIKYLYNGKVRHNTNDVKEKKGLLMRLVLTRPSFNKQQVAEDVILYLNVITEKLIVAEICNKESCICV